VEITVAVMVAILGHGPVMNIEENIVAGMGVILAARNVTEMAGRSVVMMAAILARQMALVTGTHLQMTTKTIR
jgi:hypothetical protein